MIGADQLLTILGIIGGVGTIAAGAWKGIKVLTRVIRRFNHFLDDWFGEPAHGGNVARPGIPERLTNVERRTQQLEPNGGSHLSDRVNRIETALADVSSKVDRLLTGEGNGVE